MHSVLSFSLSGRDEWLHGLSSPHRTVWAMSAELLAPDPGDGDSYSRPQQPVGRSTSDRDRIAGL
jgi:hypothetical protein